MEDILTRQIDDSLIELILTVNEYPYEQMPDGTYKCHIDGTVMTMAYDNYAAHYTAYYTGEFDPRILHDWNRSKNRITKLYSPEVNWLALTVALYYKGGVAQATVSQYLGVLRAEYKGLVATLQSI
jgi:hypothetical protein